MDFFLTRILVGKMDSPPKKFLGGFTPQIPPALVVVVGGSVGGAFFTWCLSTQPAGGWVNLVLDPLTSRPIFLIFYTPVGGTV